MTAPKSKAGGPLTRTERGRLRWLAQMLDRHASLPSDNEPRYVRVTIHMGVDLQREFINILNRAGAATSSDLRGIAVRLARGLVDRDGETPLEAARLVEKALRDDGAAVALDFGGMPNIPAARTVAAEVIRKRRR